MDARWYCRSDLDGFDLDLIGFDCADELHDEWMECGESFQFHCPFSRGCGATRAADCPMIKRLRLISLAPESRQ